MAEHTFDVEFEKYIIFHRGVAFAGVDEENNHLKIIYQDGSIQDLGDPYGDRAVKNANIAIENANTARENALISEGYAVGKQDGANVGTGSPYKDNNSKYYSERAQSFMNTANSHKNDASTYATNAQNSADAAAASAAAAHHSEEITTNILERKMPGLSYDSVTDTFYIGEIPDSSINNLFYFFLQ